MIPTAEEWLKIQKYSQWFCPITDDMGEWVMEYSNVKEAMIEFARLHVEAALKAASEKSRLYNNCNHCSGNYCECQPEINEESILTAYPKELIK